MRIVVYTDNHIRQLALATDDRSYTKAAIKFHTRSLRLTLLSVLVLAFYSDFVRGCGAQNTLFHLSGAMRVP